MYLISSPIFKETIIHLENGKALKIVTKKNNDKNIYIQSATLNGKPLTKNWFRHGDISEGGTLEFIMGAETFQMVTKWRTTAIYVQQPQIRFTYSKVQQKK